MNSENRHENYRRPEIIRNTDLLAQEQRKTLETQRKRLEYLEKKAKSEMIGIINSKIYANAESNADFCLNFCTKQIKNLNSEKNNKFIGAPLNFSVNNKNDEIDYVDENCMSNCLVKKGESFRMLMNVI